MVDHGLVQAIVDDGKAPGSVKDEIEFNAWAHLSDKVRAKYNPLPEPPEMDERSPFQVAYEQQGKKKKRDAKDCHFC